MADIKLFRVGAKVEEVKSSAVELEKKLQTLIEKNMDKFFNVRFLASEYAIPEGRMDSIGIDENNAPVIFEYKRSKDENVMSQGLFYLACLNDHLILHLKLDPKRFPYEKGFSRDVTKIGHYGTGNVQLRLHNAADYEKAKPFLRQAYDEN